MGNDIQCWSLTLDKVALSCPRQDRVREGTVRRGWMWAAGKGRQNAGCEVRLDPYQVKKICQILYWGGRLANGNRGQSI